MAKTSGASLRKINSLIKKLNLIPEAVFDAAEETIKHHSTDIASTASAMAPADAGELRRKIKARKTKRQKTKVLGTVMSNALHGIHVEYGTAEQDPQPYMRPAAHKGNRLADMVSRIKEAFKKVSR